MKSTLRQASGLIITSTLIAGMAAGCANEEEPPAPDNTGSRAQALTGEVVQASAQPSGELSASSIDGLFAVFDDWDICVGGGDLPGGLSFDVDDIDPACVTGGDLEASVDLACASGGTATGSVSYAVKIQGETIYVHYVFDDVCNNGVCGDGEGAVKVGYDASTGSSEVVVAGELDLYFQDQWRSLKYGVTVASGPSGSSQDIVLWVDGESFVLSLSQSGLGSSVEIEGSNGSWSCDVSASAGSYSGSCSGEGSFEF